MELIFPWVLYIGIPIVLFLFLFNWKHKIPYQEGKKVANTSFIEENPYYQKLYKQYRFFCAALLGCLLIAITLCVVMLSRPAKVKTITSEIRNRDIFLCMDISDSMDELNLKMCSELKEVVKKLDGERFGISIFNGKSVLLVPLTTDYDYILDTLDRLEVSFEDRIGYFTDDYDYLNSTDYYKYIGTLSDYGISFLGDGLSSCLYSFPDLKENTERSRLIIFTTDNELNGTPLVTLTEAAALCKKNDVKVFAVAPENVVDEAAFKKAITGTGGEYFQTTSSQAFDDLVAAIEETDVSDMQDVKTIVTDQPEALFICLLLFIGIYFVFSRKVKL